jgi:hypothetical protein
MRYQVNSLNAQIVDESGEVAGITIDGVVHVGPHIGAPESRHIRGDNPGERADRFHQGAPIRTGTRVAVDEYDGFGRVCAVGPSRQNWTAHITDEDLADMEAIHPRNLSGRKGLC